MKELKIPFFTIFFIFLFFIFYVKIAGPVPFSVNSIQTTKTDFFQVSGTGKETAIPDTAFISFSVTKKALTISDAQNQTNTLMEQITTALKNLGIQDKYIKTTNYSVEPNYDFNNNNQITGYTVTQSVDLTIKPIDLANKAIDALTAQGANVLGSVTFGFDEQTTNDLQNKARRDAVLDAKQKAQALADAAGIRLGKIVNVQESFEPFPVRFGGGGGPLMAKTADALTVPTNVTPGENSISVTITLSYETY